MLRSQKSRSKPLTRKRKGKKLKERFPTSNKSKPTQESRTGGALTGKQAKLAEEISSDSDSGVSDHIKDDDDVLSEEDLTEQEKRIKLAKKYLNQIETEEPDDGGVSQRLKNDALEKSRQLQKKVADECVFRGASTIKALKGHRLPVTSLIVSSDDRFAFSGSKDGGIMKWSITEFKRLKFIPGGPKSDPNLKGHAGCVTALALSSDFKFLASGDDEKTIYIWNPENVNRIHTFNGHRAGITGLTFRMSSHQLFSSSEDRSVKIWNLDEMGYVETLFGHQDTITSIDSLLRDRALTSGGRDNTVRLWKVPEESQLVFQGNGGSIDCVCFINEQHFLSGSDNGSISVWGLQKKKPLHTIAAAHGQQQNKENNWITALAALPNTDLVASASHDGFVRVWKCSDDFKSLKFKCEIPVIGFVNALKFSKSGAFLLAGVGQEHSRGRWWRIKEAKNVVLVIPLNAQFHDQNKLQK